MPTDPTGGHPGEGAVDLVVRRAEATDLPALADLYCRVRNAAYPAMPRGMHPPEEVRAWFAGWDLDLWEVWLAEAEGEPVGYAVLESAWLHSIYVAPETQGSGVGGALLDLAKARRPDGFCLWVFESNGPARRFYARRGLVELERTDGSGNEERAPDIRMAWPGGRPLVFYRRLIDEVDAALGDLLARRVALTRVVQQVKAGTGATGRDEPRERAIVAGLAARAPELGAERLARILDVVISESLGATR